MTAAYLEPEAACEIFGGPRGILAWAPGPGTARVVEDGYLVTATWSFASDSRHATGLGCHVSVVEADGTPRLNADGSPVIRTMLFPKSNARMTDIWHVIGLKGTGSDRFSVEDLFVPQRNSATTCSTPGRHRLWEPTASSLGRPRKTLRPPHREMRTQRKAPSSRCRRWMRLRHRAA